MSKCSHAPLQTWSSTPATFIYLWTTVDSVPRWETGEGFVILLVWPSKTSLYCGDSLTVPIITVLWGKQSVIGSKKCKQASVIKKTDSLQGKFHNKDIHICVKLDQNLTFSVWWLLAQSSAVVTHCEGHFGNGNRQAASEWEHSCGEWCMLTSSLLFPPVYTVPSQSSREWELQPWQTVAESLIFNWFEQLTFPRKQSMLSFFDIMQ